MKGVSFQEGANICRFRFRKRSNQIDRHSITQKHQANTKMLTHSWAQRIPRKREQSWEPPTSHNSPHTHDSFEE